MPNERRLTKQRVVLISSQLQNMTKLYEMENKDYNFQPNSIAGKNLAPAFVTLPLTMK